MGSISSSLGRRRIASFTALFSVTFSLLMIGFYTGQGLMESSPVTSQNKSSTTTKSTTPSFNHRNLLSNRHAEEEKEIKKKNGNMKMLAPKRIWSEKCSKSDIVISQGTADPLPNGIPTYMVEIVNVCVSGCDISAIHLGCGWFSSARLVNPRVFRRLRYNDCLVNDGKPLLYGRTLSFQYANTFRYPLAVASVKC